METYLYDWQRRHHDICQLVNRGRSPLELKTHIMTICIYRTEYTYAPPQTPSLTSSKHWKTHIPHQTLFLCKGMWRYSISTTVNGMSKQQIFDILITDLCSSWIQFFTVNSSEIMRALFSSFNKELSWDCWSYTRRDYQSNMNMIILWEKTL